MEERIQRLTAAKARAVLVGNTAELNPDRCCPNCGAMLNAAGGEPLWYETYRRRPRLTYCSVDH